MQNWDGSGGNGAALRHFEATGSKYPLVVKLGTITPHGADVFSYAPDENDMVEDPKLVRQWTPCSLMWTATWHVIEQSHATSEHSQMTSSNTAATHVFQRVECKTFETRLCSGLMPLAPTW